MKFKKIFIALVLIVSTSQAFVFDTFFIQNWDYEGENHGILFPIGDGDSGGNSSVLDMNDKVVSECLEGEPSCFLELNLEGTYEVVDWTVSYMESKLKITDFVPSSQSGWGWATAGWWYIPNYDSLATGESIFDRAAPAGLNEDSWIGLSLEYDKGEVLTIEFKGEGIDENDSLQSPPRYSYTGKGAYDCISFPMSQVKRAYWSQPTTYDVTKVTAIGMLRKEAALSEGAEFPTNVKETTNFKLAQISSDGTCTRDYTMTPVLTSSEGITLLGKEVQVYSVSGEQVWSGLWTGSLSSLSKGLYFVKWEDQVLKFNHEH